MAERRERELCVLSVVEIKFSIQTLDSIGTINEIMNELNNFKLQWLIWLMLLYKSNLQT